MTIQRSKVSVAVLPAPPADSGEALLTRTIGHCTLESVLGVGGMGTVYLARHKTLRKQVAVKILRRDLPTDFKGVQRFLREASAAAQLDHPNIVSVYDAGEEGGFNYIVMQYVPGESLASRLRREGVLPVEEAIRVFRAVAMGISHAHASGFVHRDVKPDNVLLGEGGDVKIADFGLARAVEGDPNLSRTGTILGSPNFMSPEQAIGSRVDQRTDIYSLGATLYHMVVGAPPFQADTTLGIMYKVVREPLALPHAVNPKLPVPLSRYISLLMRKDPRRRPATVHQCLRILEQIEPACRSRRRWWVPQSRLVGVATFAAAAALLALGALLGPWPASWWGPTTGAEGHRPSPATVPGVGAHLPVEGDEADAKRSGDDRAPNADALKEENRPAARAGADRRPSGGADPRTE